MTPGANQQQADKRTAAQLAMKARPKLTAETAVDYLDWITSNMQALAQGGHNVPAHMQAAELAIRTRATDAQAKATQHTLVEEGLMEAPTASR